MVTNPFNAYVTTNAAGSFNVDSTGFVQGDSVDNPSARQFLTSGVLAASETLPMWGGVAISEYVPGVSGGPNSILGGTIGRATTQSMNTAGQVTGFSVNDQNYAAMNSPLNPVPLTYSGGPVNFYRLGTGARVMVAMDASLVDLEGNIITSQVSWDFTNQVLQPYNASTGSFAISAAAWSATNGGQIAVTTSAAVPFGLGDAVTVSGATNSGTGGATAINTSFVVSGYTSNESFILAAPATTGVFGTIAGSPVITAGTGALPVRIERVQIGKSMVVNYNPVTGIATWNRTGNAAIIIL